MDMDELAKQFEARLQILLEEARKETEAARKETEAARKETEAARKETEAAEAARKENEAVARKETEAARKETEAARKETEAAEAERQKIAIKKIFDNGLPKGRKVIITSKASTSTQTAHAPVKFIESEFAIVVENLEEISNCQEASLIMLSSAISDGYVDYSSESDLQGFVKLVIQDMISAAGLAKKITLLNEITFKNFRPDIWVLESGETMKIPIGSVEVKKSKNDINNLHCLGQIFDYLYQLRELHGRKEVFGIITNYESWRIVWLPDCDLVARHQCEDISSVPMSPTSGLMPRELSGTSEIPYNEPALPRYIVSLIRKLAYSQAIPRGILDATKAYIEIGQDLYHWVVRSDLVKLTLKFPRRSVTKFLLLRDFKYGCDGRVWLACSNSGNLCVVKFLRDSTSEEGKAEAANWEELYGVQAFSMELIENIPAVIMPFAFHCKEIDAGTHRFEPCLSRWSYSETFPDQNYLEEVVSAVIDLDPVIIARQAIDVIVSKGYIHDDVKWIHVAALPRVQDDGTVTFSGILIDLTRITKLGSEIDPETARNQMLRSLGL